MKYPKVDAIVPLHNRCRTIRRVVDAILGQKVASIGNLIIVDDGSRDGSLDELTGLDLQIVRLPTPTSPGQARNCGVEASDADWYWFVDDDCEPALDLLRSFLSICKNHPELVVVSSSIIKNRPENYWQRLDNYLHFRSFLDDRPAFFDKRFSSFSLFVRAAEFAAAGGFDPLLSVGEDADLCLRISDQGGSLRFEPELRCTHWTPRRNWRDVLSHSYRWGYGSVVARRKQPRQFHLENRLYRHSWLLLGAAPFLALAAWAKEVAARGWRDWRYSSWIPPARIAWLWGAWRFLRAEKKDRN